MIPSKEPVLPRPGPKRGVIEGLYARLEPLCPDHAEHLFAACRGPENKSRFDYLFEEQPADPSDMEQWIEEASVLSDPMFFAVVDRATGRCEGRQALMGIRPEHGSIELGAIYWGPAITRTRVATEAHYLHLKYAFDSLGYRRIEWKCNDQNEPSKRAAVRFGYTFEGLFRQHMHIKGANRDTAWFSIIDTEWPEVRSAYEDWLKAENFSADGQQKNKLSVRPG